MSKNKVLLITSRSDTGGGPRHVYELARYLKERHGTQIYIAAPSDAPFGSLFHELALDFLELPSRKFTLKCLFGLLNFCKLHNISTIHSHGRGAGIYSRLLKLFGFRIIHTYHGIHLEPSVKGRIKFLADRVLEPLTDISIFVSESERKTALNAGLAHKSNYVVINNGIELSNSIFSERGTQKIGTLSRLTYQKGIDLLIKYFHSFCTQYPAHNFELLIAGDGEDEKALKSLASSLKIFDRVSFLGQVHDTKSFLENLEVYVSTSRWEGLPLAVLEAMDSGLPCLLSYVPGHESFIDAGAALAFRSENEFVSNLFKLCEDEKLKRDLSNKASNFLKLEHNIFDQVDRTYQTYGFQL